MKVICSECGTTGNFTPKPGADKMWACGNCLKVNHHPEPKISVVATATCPGCQETVTEIDVENGCCAPCLMEMFGKWMNNFLTVERFAEYYGFDFNEARRVIIHGRMLWNERAVS